MNDQGHDSSSYFIAHHGEKDEGRCHEMMQHPFIEFPLLPSPHCEELEDGEHVHPQMEHKVYLEFPPLVSRPIWVFFVDLWAGALPTCWHREPVFGCEDYIAYDCWSGIKKSIVAEFQQHFYFAYFFFSFIFGLQYGLDWLPHEFIIGITAHLNKKRSTETRKKPRMHHLIASIENT